MNTVRVDYDHLPKRIEKMLLWRTRLVLEIPKLAPEERWRIESAIAELDGYITLTMPTDVVH